RRYLEHVRDVIETIALVVLRQQRIDVDVEREQVGDRVLVFGAVETMQRDLTWIRRFRRRIVERGLEPRYPFAALLGAGLRISRRRHLRTAELANYVLEHLGLVRHRVERHAVERDVRG